MVATGADAGCFFPRFRFTTVTQSLFSVTVAGSSGAGDLSIVPGGAGASLFFFALPFVGKTAVCGAVAELASRLLSTAKGG